jgi:hypothetical protein
MIVACQEKDGMHARRVVPLIKEPKALQEVAQKMAAVPNFLDGLSWQAMMESDFVGVLVDGVGIVALDRLRPGENARAHITFWDGRLRGRELLCKRVAHMWMERYQLNCIYTAVPLEARKVALFCERLGFSAVAIEDGFVHFVMYPPYLHGANRSPGGS